MSTRSNKNNDDNLEASFAEISLSPTKKSLAPTKISLSPIMTRSATKRKPIQEDNSKIETTNRTSKSSKNLNQTPKKPINKRSSNNKLITPTRQSQRVKKVNELTTKTVSPIVIKNGRVIKSDKNILNVNQTTEESNDECSEELDQLDESNDNQLNESNNNQLNESNDNQLNESNEKTNSKENLNDKSDDENYNPIFDYFKERSITIKRSKNTINKIDFNMIKNVDKDLRYNNNIKNLIIQHYKENQFQEIYDLLICNFNVILYGFGSKRSLVNEFKNEYLLDENFLKIDGFYPQLNLKIILINLSKLFKLETTSKEDEFYEAACNLEENIFLVINSIDQLFKTDLKIKKFLIKLYEKSNGHLHILSTIDHLNAGLMFDLKEEGKLNLVYLNSTTHELYNLEYDFIKSSTKSNNKILDIDIQQQTMSSIISVYNTLPEKSKDVLKLIFRDWLKHQEFRKQTNKDNDDDDDTKGLSYSNILTLCRESFYSNSANAFRQQLVELKDHELIKTIKIEGNEYIIVLIDDHLIQMFLNEHDN